MKKRIFTIIAAFLLLFGVTGQAAAYFEQGHLYRVVYDRGGTYEVVTDLGAGLNATAATTVNHVLNDNNFSMSQLGASSWNNVYVAYFTFTTNAVSGANGLWASGLADGQNILSRQWNTTAGKLTNVKGLNVNTGQVQNVNLQAGAASNYGSYSKQLLTAGKLGTQIATTSPSFVDQNLSALATIGYVDQYLYYYDATKLAASSGTPAGLRVEMIRTFADGHTEINPVPVPAAIYLLGTGLLGLIGIRRRMATA